MRPADLLILAFLLLVLTLLAYARWPRDERPTATVTERAGCRHRATVRRATATGLPS